MKFGALLRGSAEGTPELQSLFLCYKHLKKRLKRLPERANADQAPDAAAISEDEMAQRQRNFVMTLNEDVNQVRLKRFRSPWSME
jgi:hypothetical protein